MQLCVSMIVNINSQACPRARYDTYAISLISPSKSAFCRSIYNKISEMASSEIKIRPAVEKDIPAVNKIHKHYVENTVITFITEPNSDSDALENFNKTKNLGLPYLVAVDSSETVLGYTYVGPFRGVKPGYRHTLELSLFLSPDHVRKGIGKLLLTRIIAILEKPEEWREWFEGSRLLEYKPKQLLAVMAIDIDGPGRGLKLRDWYVKSGFEERGGLKEVGWKKERWIDTVYLQKTLRS